MGAARELIAKHLASADELEAEMALLRAQPAEKQSIVEERLSYIDAYSSLDKPSVADVDAAAAKLGVSRRQFYRLLSKLRTYGPVRALTPGYQNVVRASAVREGLSEPIERVLSQALSSDPDIRISRLQALIASECERLEVAPPTDWMLRQRIHQLRSTGIVARKADFGAQIVIDQVSLDVSIDDVGGPRFAIFTAIVDRSTKLIIGSSLLTRDLFGDGLAKALKDMADHGFALVRREQLPVAKVLEELVWIAPPSLEKLADSEATMRRHTPDGVVKIVSVGRRRHGDALLRLIGDRIGPYELRARRDLDLLGGRPEGKGMPFEDAERVVRYCVDAWNKRLILKLSKIDAQDRAKQVRRLNRIARELRSWFEPILEEANSHLDVRRHRNY